MVLTHILVPRYVPVFPPAASPHAVRRLCTWVHEPHGPHGTIDWADIEHMVTNGTKIRSGTIIRRQLRAAIWSKLLQGFRTIVASKLPQGISQNCSCKQNKIYFCFFRCSPNPGLGRRQLDSGCRDVEFACFSCL